MEHRQVVRHLLSGGQFHSARADTQPRESGAVVQSEQRTATAGTDRYDDLQVEPLDFVHKSIFHTGSR